MRRLALLGAGGHAKVVADAALLAGWESVAMFADGPPAAAHDARWPRLGDADALLARLAEFDGVLVAIGDCDARLAQHRRLRDAGAPMATVVHPRATVSPHARLGGGSVLMAGAIVNVDAVLGEACIVNTGATVDHDCRLGDGVHIAPGAHLSGAVVVGERSWIGVGAAVRQGMRIGAGVTVGAGAVVVSTVTDDITVVGVPARAR